MEDPIKLREAQALTQTQIDALFDELEQTTDPKKKDRILGKIFRLQGIRWPPLIGRASPENFQQIRALYDSNILCLVLVLLGLKHGQKWEQEDGIRDWREILISWLNFRIQNAFLHYP